jgi:HK97 gp10 family phage protein
MATNFVKVQIKSMQAAFRAAAELEKRLKRGAIRIALTNAATPVLRRVKALCPVDTGLLKKSLKRKVTTNKRRNSVSVIIGADKNVKGEKNGKKVRPARYIHAVERGHGGPHAAPPKPFLRPAYESTHAEVQRIYAAELKPAIERRAAQLGRRRVA